MDPRNQASEAHAAPPQLARTIEQLSGDLAVVTERTVSQIRRELPTYNGVPTSGLQASVQRNLNIALRALRSGIEPKASDLPEAEITGRERARQGVPVEDMMRAYRLNIGNVQRRFLELASDNGVPAELALDGAQLLWSVSDAFTTRLALVYQELSVEDALHDAQRRSEFVRSLLAGTLDQAELVRSCTLYGLDPGAAYTAIRARRGSRSEDVETLRRLLERSGSTPQKPALVVVLGSDCAGVVAQRPAIRPGWVAGVGAELPLSEITSSYRTATRAVEVASRLRRHGVYGMQELSWRLAAVADDEVTTYLVGRYMAPLRTEGEFGRLLKDTLRAYFDNGLSIKRTADTLVIHVNTLRYRLRRFSEIAGVSLSSTDVIVELAWALELEALP